MTKNFLRKIIASGTSICLLVTQLLFADPAAAQTPVYGSEVRVSASLAMALPSAFGTIEASHAGSGPLVVHIQEAHGNPEVQEKIRQILHHLRKEYGIDLVLLEGTAFKLHPELLDFYPKDSKRNQDLWKRLMEAGLLTGPEQYLAEDKTASAYGIEEIKPYVQNGRAFVATHDARQQSDRFLRDLDLQIERLMATQLNPNLRKFLREQEQFESQIVSLAGWLTILKKAANQTLNLNLEDPREQIDWPMLLRVFTLRRLEEKTDTGALETEKRAFLEVLSKFIPKTEALYREIEKSLDVSAQERTLSDPETGLLFEAMVERLPQDFPYARYPNVNRAIGHRILQSELKGDRIIGELEKLEGLISEKLAQAPEEKEIVSILKDYKLLQKLFSLELTPEDYERVLAQKSAIQPAQVIGRFAKLNQEKRVKDIQFKPADSMEVLFDKAMEFYRIAKERDGIMTQNIEKRLKETGKTKAVVITGGFHAQPFEHALAQKGFAYARITPRMTHPGGSEKYTQLVMETFKPQTSTWMRPQLATSTPAEADALQFSWRIFMEKVRQALEPVGWLAVSRARWPSVTAGVRSEIRELANDFRTERGIATVRAEVQAQGNLRVLASEPRHATSEVDLGAARRTATTFRAEVRKGFEDYAKQLSQMEKKPAALSVDAVTKLFHDIQNKASILIVTPGKETNAQHQRFIRDYSQVGDLAIAALFLEYLPPDKVFEALLERHQRDGDISFGVRSRGLAVSRFVEDGQKMYVSPPRAKNEDYEFWILKEALRKPIEKPTWRVAVETPYKRSAHFSEPLHKNQCFQKGANSVEDITDLEVKEHHAAYILRKAKSTMPLALVSSRLVEQNFNTQVEISSASVRRSAIEILRSRPLVRSYASVPLAEKDLLAYIDTMTEFRRQRTVFLRMQAQERPEYEKQFAAYQSASREYENERKIRASQGNWAWAGTHSSPDAPDELFSPYDDAIVKMEDEVRDQAKKWVRDHRKDFQIKAETARKRSKQERYFLLLDPYGKVKEDQAMISVLRFLLGWGYVERELDPAEDAKEQIDQYTFLVDHTGAFYLGKGYRLRGVENVNLYWKEALAVQAAGGHANYVQVTQPEPYEAPGLMQYYKGDYDEREIRATGHGSVIKRDHRVQHPYVSSLTLDYEDRYPGGNPDHLVTDLKTLRSWLLVLEIAMRNIDPKFTNLQAVEFQKGGASSVTFMKIDPDSPMHASDQFMISPEPRAKIFELLYYQQRLRYDWVFQPEVFTQEAYDMNALREAIEYVQSWGKDGGKLIKKFLKDAEVSGEKDGVGNYTSVISSGFSGYEETREILYAEEALKLLRVTSGTIEADVTRMLQVLVGDPTVTILKARSEVRMQKRPWKWQPTIGEATGDSRRASSERFIDPRLAERNEILAAAGIPESLKVPGLETHRIYPWQEIHRRIPDYRELPNMALQMVLQIMRDEGVFTGDHEAVISVANTFFSALGGRPGIFELMGGALADAARFTSQDAEHTGAVIRIAALNLRDLDLGTPFARIKTEIDKVIQDQKKRVGIAAQEAHAGPVPSLTLQDRYMEFWLLFRITPGELDKVARERGHLYFPEDAQRLMRDYEAVGLAPAKLGRLIVNNWDIATLPSSHFESQLGLSLREAAMDLDLAVKLLTNPGYKINRPTFKRKVEVLREAGIPANEILPGLRSLASHHLAVLRFVVAQAKKNKITLSRVDTLRQLYEGVLDVYGRRELLKELGEKNTITGAFAEKLERQFGEVIDQRMPPDFKDLVMDYAAELAKDLDRPLPQKASGTAVLYSAVYSEIGTRYRLYAKGRPWPSHPERALPEELTGLYKALEELRLPQAENAAILREILAEPILEVLFNIGAMPLELLEKITDLTTLATMFGVSPATMGRDDHLSWAVKTLVALKPGELEDFPAKAALLIPIVPDEEARLLALYSLKDKNLLVLQILVEEFGIGKMTAEQPFGRHLQESPYGELRRLYELLEKLDNPTLAERIEDAGRDRRRKAGANTKDNLKGKLHDALEALEASGFKNARPAVSSRAEATQAHKISTPVEERLRRFMKFWEGKERKRKIDEAHGVLKEVFFINPLLLDLVLDVLEGETTTHHVISSAKRLRALIAKINKATQASHSMTATDYLREAMKHRQLDAYRALVQKAIDLALERRTGTSSVLDVERLLVYHRAKGQALADAGMSPENIEEAQTVIYQIQPDLFDFLVKTVRGKGRIFSKGNQIDAVAKRLTDYFNEPKRKAEFKEEGITLEKLIKVEPDQWPSGPKGALTRAFKAAPIPKSVSGGSVRRSEVRKDESTQPDTRSLVSGARSPRPGVRGVAFQDRRSEVRSIVVHKVSKKNFAVGMKEVIDKAAKEIGHGFIETGVGQLAVENGAPVWASLKVGSVFQLAAKLLVAKGFHKDTGKPHYRIRAVQDTGTHWKLEVVRAGDKTSSEQSSAGQPSFLGSLLQYWKAIGLGLIIIWAIILGYFFTLPPKDQKGSAATQSGEQKLTYHYPARPGTIPAAQGTGKNYQYQYLPSPDRLLDEIQQTTGPVRTILELLLWAELLEESGLPWRIPEYTVDFDRLFKALEDNPDADVGQFASYTNNNNVIAALLYQAGRELNLGDDFLRTNTDGTVAVNMREISVINDDGSVKVRRIPAATTVVTNADGGRVEGWLIPGSTAMTTPVGGEFLEQVNRAADSARAWDKNPKDSEDYLRVMLDWLYQRTEEAKGAAAAGPNKDSSAKTYLPPIPSSDDFKDRYGLGPSRRSIPPTQPPPVGMTWEQYLNVQFGVDAWRPQAPQPQPMGTNRPRSELRAAIAVPVSEAPFYSDYSFSAASRLVVDLFREGITPLRLAASKVAGYVRQVIAQADDAADVASRSLAMLPALVRAKIKLLRALMVAFSAKGTATAEVPVCVVDVVSGQPNVEAVASVLLAKPGNVQPILFTSLDAAGVAQFLKELHAFAFKNLSPDVTAEVKNFTVVRIDPLQLLENQIEAYLNKVANGARAAIIVSSEYKVVAERIPKNPRLLRITARSADHAAASVAAAVLLKSISDNVLQILANNGMLDANSLFLARGLRDLFNNMNALVAILRAA